jgi:hypothetical protein
MTGLRRGQIVAVEFLDHIEGGTEPMRFVVYGELAAVGRKALSIDSWAYRDKALPHDRNERRFVIVRAAVQRITILQPRAD